MTENSKNRVFRAAVVVIGNEILSGRTQDTNTQWIAEKAGQHGIVLGEVRVVPDDEAAIIAAVNALRPCFDYVFTTGGIGPTHDDITAASVARAFGRELVRSDEAFRVLELHYGIENMTPPRVKMCMVPDGAGLIPNPVSAAPGFVVDNVYVMAGVPRIMQAMMDHVLSGLEKGAVVLSNTISCNLSEGVIAESLSAVQDRHREVAIGSYPYFRAGHLGLSLVLRSPDEAKLRDATRDLVAAITALGGTPQGISMAAEV